MEKSICGLMQTKLSYEQSKIRTSQSILAKVFRNGFQQKPVELMMGYIGKSTYGLR
jgi:hypothetical protein